jgi:hypothetical protein
MNSRPAHHKKSSASGNKAVLALTAGVMLFGVLFGSLALVESGATNSATKKPTTDVLGRQAKGRSDRSIAKIETYLSSYGVVSSQIVAENKLPGTTSWQLTNTGAPGYIQGFADKTYARIGEKVTLYISSTAPTYQVFAYRMGYYQGKGAHLVWSSPLEKGFVQASCPLTPVVNMVSCDNWTPSLTVDITKNFFQGDYIFKLVGSQGQQSWIPLTVWDPASNATYLIKNDVFTWQAWNPYGGYDFYVGQGSCPSNHYPLCSRARVVSFDRPYAYGGGAADFMVNEYPLVRFMEKHGLNVAYANDQTVIEHPNILENHVAVLSLGHDECWSYRERVAATNAQNHGVNFIFFGASAMLRHVRLQPSPLGQNREEVDYRNSYKDPLYGKGNPLEVTGNTWMSPPASWPETGFVGESYAGFLLNGATPAPFVVADASAWIFKGTGLKDGSAIPGVLQSDFDHFYTPNPHPNNLQILGHSPIPISRVVTDLGTQNGYAYSDMTYYTTANSNAGVFDSGTNNWINSLTSCGSSTANCPATYTRKITANLLWLFGQGPTGELDPSTATYSTFYPS